MRTTTLIALIGTTTAAVTLAECVKEHTDADCKALKKTNDEALTAAKKTTSDAKTAHTACAAKTYKKPETADKECKADETAFTDATAK